MGTSPLFLFGRRTRLLGSAFRTPGFPERSRCSASTPVAETRRSGFVRPSDENLDIDPKTAPVWDIAEPIALELGLELVDIEYRREGRGAVLRLLIDKSRGGVTLDELTAVSRQLSDVLDVRDDAVSGAYTLEVSSPGINRPLTRPSHFPAFVG